MLNGIPQLIITNFEDSKDFDCVFLLFGIVLWECPIFTEIKLVALFAFFNAGWQYGESK